ncbi:hypothetical protein H8356DRAFT_1351804 [Neocallimastix lanati (nom. inval.)]|nr:hypothetical protein H8356DRAFT_1351804 [Neocallimastix sp. JGI-2020a]
MTWAYNTNFIFSDYFNKLPSKYDTIGICRECICEALNNARKIVPQIENIQINKSMPQIIVLQEKNLSFIDLIIPSYSTWSSSIIPDMKNNEK